MAVAIAWGDLAGLYGKLVGGIGFGVFLFWIGVPVSCVAFIRRADLSVELPLQWGRRGLLLLSRAVLRQFGCWERPTGDG